MFCWSGKVFNKSDNVVVIVDNYYSAATGGQDVLSSRATNNTKATNNPIEAALKGVGVEWILRLAPPVPGSASAEGAGRHER